MATSTQCNIVAIIGKYTRVPPMVNVSSFHYDSNNGTLMALPTKIQCINKEVNCG
ncbi:hypothetical protein F441_03900 [Phytophthora nicotianae CJ01A1]|nr:hypothetical protein L917_03666 [Phytophthora nicotianae]ETO81780.1 hypothetical protein F444_03982 [Phytophthora nicotianae P1976]ETP22893.1 hypothetical protein F441_03900 [Phytophthora nicotianae CJ01A1]